MATTTKKTTTSKRTEATKRLTPSPAYVEARTEREAAEARLEDYKLKLSRASTHLSKLRRREEAGDPDVLTLDLLAAERDTPRLERAVEVAERELAATKESEAPHAARHVARDLREVMAQTDLSQPRAEIAEAVVSAATPLLLDSLGVFDALIEERTTAVRESLAALRSVDVDGYRYQRQFLTAAQGKAEREREYQGRAGFPGLSNSAVPAPAGGRADSHAALREAEETIQNHAAFAEPLEGDPHWQGHDLVMDGAVVRPPSRNAAHKELVALIASKLTAAILSVEAAQE